MGALPWVCLLLNEISPGPSTVLHMIRLLMYQPSDSFLDTLHFVIVSLFKWIVQNTAQCSGWDVTSVEKGSTIFSLVLVLYFY